ncbi:c-type cytochrome [Arenimonas composti]|uniref:Cytochrome c domain-containing protein n=1 Tax=Arenimonas composti TR7-09 = DSM 18010 TaxID=1121013 RepID=A0A091C0A6_9GAMM|nr:c-type cytochrome [Arenimonas composti]KFN50050.1 hypothetical protein P873_08400 [Arenimonas composti TR7-09 = DSM 18010]
MGKWFKRVATLAGLFLAAVAGIYGLAWLKSEAALARIYTVDDPPLVFAGDEAERVRGEHLYNVLTCVECHAEGGTGKLWFDAGPVGRAVAPNLTPAAIAGRYDADGLAAAIRHGVRPDGTPLRYMPVGDYHRLSDADTAALVRYLQSLPPAPGPAETTVIGPLARVLHLFGKIEMVPAELLDHTPRRREAPPVAATAAYGDYLAQVCTGCHGADFAGQRVPGTPPELPPAANLTPHADGLAGWSEADFLRAIREGRRPDGSEIHPFMPWRTYSRMTDVELQAIWAHLSRLPPAKSRS